MNIIFGLFGGLAVFIYGMNLMSESLQKVAGSRMKSVLEALTRNPVTGVLAGTLVTAVLQSSSATTVLVIGFVSAHLMSLPQAVSVILGANIGTTMTAQLIAFKISDYIWPIVFTGFLIQFSARSEKVKNTGMSIFSFGLLFAGIETMGAVMKPLAKSAFFIDLMAKVTKIPAFGVLLGTVMTLVVQSSSATIAVLQNFASQPGADGISSAIGLAGAIPILLGDNIGTTITALMASIGQSRDSKRAALAHSIFNISGAFVFVWFIAPFAEFVRFISPKGEELSVISRQIANAHMSFNIINTIIWLPLIPLMVKIVTALVKKSSEEFNPEETSKSKKFSSENETFFLDKYVLSQPAAAIILISKEIKRASDYTSSMLHSLKKIFEKKDSSLLEEISSSGIIVQTITKKTSLYISELISLGSLTQKQSFQCASLLNILNDIERISERCLDIMSTAQKSFEKKNKFSSDAIKELSEILHMAEKLFFITQEAMQGSDRESAEIIFTENTALHSKQKKFTKNHTKRLEKKECRVENAGAFTNILHNIERISSSCAGIAEEVLDNIQLEEEKKTVCSSPQKFTAP